MPELLDSKGRKAHGIQAGARKGSRTRGIIAHELIHSLEESGAGQSALLPDGKAGILREAKLEAGETAGGHFKNAVENSKNGVIIKSGALNPEGEAAQKHADQYYESVRKMNTDVAKIAKATGYTEAQIQEIKDFIFNEEHDLGDRIGRFDSDYMMAQSWQRLVSGDIEAA